MILCTALPVTTTVAGEWLGCLIFHDDIKCITANGQLIIYVGADYIYVSCDGYSFCTKSLGSTLSFLLYTYGFKQHHMISA